MFDIQTTATIIERKAHAAPVTSLLFARSTAFPAVRSAHEAVPSWLDPQYDPSSGVEGGVGMGSGIGMGSGMGDMFDLSPDRPKTRNSGSVTGVSGKSNISGKSNSSGAGHLLLFSAGTYTAKVTAKATATATAKSVRIFAMMVLLHRDTLLYSALLCFTLLHYTLLHSTLHYYSTLCSALLNCNLLYCALLYSLCSRHVTSFMPSTLLHFFFFSPPASSFHAYISPIRYHSSYPSPSHPSNHCDLTPF